MKWVAVLALSLGANAAELSILTEKTGPVRPETIALSGLTTANQYSLLYSLRSLRELTAETRVVIEVRQGDAVLASKTLHLGDPDYYTQFRVPRAGAAQVVIRASHASGDYLLQVNRWPLSSQVKSEPDHSWQDAQTIELGKTIFASGDDEEYIPLPGTPRKALPEFTDWYKFEFASDRPKLVFFQIDLMERDQIPVDVRVYHLEEYGDASRTYPLHDGTLRLLGPRQTLVPYYEGEDPVTLPHEVQALQGNKFTPRILKDKGTYYISVHAGHPEYKLRTRIYNAPPYSDPHEAVRTGVDYIMAAGDSWHANTPRRGGILDRVASVHQETSLCVGCHTTLVTQIRVAAESRDALIRQAAVEALGRLGENSAALGDASKIVQRTAAWAMRQQASRRSISPINLNSTDDRTRWGIARVFAQHFSELAKQPGFAAGLVKLADDPVITIRMNAIKGLWQFWFWTPDVATKSMIEDALLAALGHTQHEWVAENLRHAIYNLADENIRYLYNNWVPLMGRAEDREKAVRGRLAVESRLAAKFATVLEQGLDMQKKALLAALTELPLRRGDVYDLDADLGKKSPPVYNRIGNDIEQIAFFGESAERLSRALLPLLESKDDEMRRLAERASILVRDVKFADVNRIAGPAGESTRALISRVEVMPEAVEVAHVLKPPPPMANRAAANGPRVRVRLDESFFRGYVEPILQKRGKDGYACVHCHASHTLFNATYSTVMNVVDTADPESSLILRKPTSTAETEGVAGSAVLAHGGGVRFAKDSPEYVTILQWIKGAKE